MMRNLIKKVYFYFLDRALINKFFLWRQEPGVTILTYHSVLPNSAPIQKYEYRNCVTQQQFLEQIRFLKRYFKIVSLEEALSLLKKGELKQHYAVITFDDGYKNNYLYALPVLKEEKVSASFFLTTGLIGSNDCLWTDWITYLLFHSKNSVIELNLPNHHFHFELACEESRIRASVMLRSFLKMSQSENLQNVLDQLKEQVGDILPPVQGDPDRYAFLNWQEVKAMNEAGMDIGAHTHNHLLLRMLSDEQAYFELSTSKKIIEKNLGKFCLHFAYPNGGRNDFNEKHIAFLKELGFKAAVTQIPGINRPGTDLFRLKRINISNKMTLPVFKAYVSGTYNKK